MEHSARNSGGFALAACTLLLATGVAAAAGSTGPLFGLTAAPNGRLLVADTGAGVVDARTRLLLAPLPGITDISAIGTGALWVTRTGSDPLEDTGQGLYRVSNGKAHLVVDLYAFEKAHDPHPGDPVESNPFDVQALSAHAALVVDAAGNDLLRVNSHGRVRVLAVFPDALASTGNLKSLFHCPAGPANICGLPDRIPAEAVPTSVTIGPDGWYYVGELKGFPAPTGESRIWRVAPWASSAACGHSKDCQLVFDGGFTSIIDMAFGPDGLLYVAELDEASWFAVEVLRTPTTGTVNACDVRTHACVEVKCGLVEPTAIAFSKRGRLWATEYALTPPMARLVEIP